MKILGQSWNGLLFQGENFTLTPVMLHPMIIIRWIASEVKGQHIQAGLIVHMTAAEWARLMR